MSTSTVWERVLVTGGLGFVGSYLKAALIERGLEANLIICGGPNDKNAAVPLDVRDETQVTRLIEEVRPTAVVHLAAIAAVTAANSDARQAWAVNLGGTLNLVEAIRSKSPDTRLLFVSSAEVYGRSLNSHSAVAETALLDPVNPYAASKAAADILVRQSAAQGVKAVIARPFNHTGPGQAEAFAVPSFAGQIARIEKGLQPPILSVGNLDDQRDFLDVRDVVNAYLSMLELCDALPAGATFNIASGEPVRIGDILEHLLSLSTVKIEVRLDPARLRPAPIPRVAGDATAARAVLHWEPRFALNDSLAAILDHTRQRLGA